MRNLHALIVIFILLFSTINSPIFFSSIALSEEAPTSTSGSTSGGSGTATSSGGSSSGTSTTSGTTQTTATTQTTSTAPTTTTETKTETTTTAQQPSPTETTTQPTETKTSETPPSRPICPQPPAPVACGENQGMTTKYDDKGCPIGYECKETQKIEVGKVAACPEISSPRIECQANERLNKITDDKGCVTGYNCVSVVPAAGGGEGGAQPACQSAPEKPSCNGNLVPVFDRGCLISYSCVPQGCVQETDQSGFVRVACKQEKTCVADGEQAKLKSQCYSQGGNPIPFQDPSGCTFYDCRFDNRGIDTNPLGGHQACPSGEEEKKMINQCRDTGLTPRFSFDGGCKIVKCSQEAGPACARVSDSEKSQIENECSAKGLPIIRSIDNSGCAFYRCGDTAQSTCQRDVPPEAYKKCDSTGGEMVVKNDRNGCVAFSQCVTQGDEKDAYVKPVEEVPDATVLLSLALKLEHLKIELQKLASESKEISKYYASTDSLDGERYTRVSTMFDSAAGKVDEIKLKIKDNVDQLTTDDLEEIRHDVKYIKEVMLKDILYVMLSNSDDIKETLESSRKISAKSSIEEIAQNAKDCGTEGSCFDRAIRSCKPVTFQPEGRSGPLISITGLRDRNCVLHVSMQSSDQIPPGYSKDNFFMDCPIADYALGVRGPEDILPTCEGPMAKFAKQFGGGGVTGGESFPPPEGGPGGCESEKECATYCIDNYDECKKWVEEHPAYGPIPTKAELRKFASGEAKELSSSQRGATAFSGPGGCKGPQECEKFCRSNPDECLKWCDENPGICPQEKVQQAGKSGQPSTLPEKRTTQQSGVGQQQGGKCPDGICDEFEKANPDACPQDCGGVSQHAQPAAVQACVGCLNNGVCDIGECSECADCLRTGSVNRPAQGSVQPVEPVSSVAQAPQQVPVR